MRLVNFSASNRKPAVGLLVEDRVYAIDAYPDMRAFLSAGPCAMDAARRIHDGILAGFSLPSLERSEIRLEAPVKDPSKIICLGHNYKDFISETGVPTPPAPRLIAKYSNAICGPEDPIIYPRETRELGYEAEMAFVIGKPARRVTEEAALSYIAGYTVLNDVTASDVQALTGLGGKTFDNFAPTGPFLVTGDEVGDPGNLGIACWVNGIEMQRSNTNQLLYDVPYLVAFLSRIFTLMPGDIVATGTPGGLAKYRNPPAFMKPGDVCTVWVERLGYLENRVVSED